MASKEWAGKLNTYSRIRAWSTHLHSSAACRNTHTTEQSLRSHKSELPAHTHKSELPAHTHKSELPAHTHKSEPPAHTHNHRQVITFCIHLQARDKTLYLSWDMRFPTMWYVRPSKPQISLRICAVWSEPLLVAWLLTFLGVASYWLNIIWSF